MKLSDRDWRALLELSGQLAEISAADPAGAANHALLSLYRLTGADQGFLAFNRRRPQRRRAPDPMGGWRPAHLIYERGGLERAQRAARWLGPQTTIAYDEAALRMVAEGGTPRAYLRRELVGDSTWRRAPYVAELLAPMGVRDRMFAGVPLARDLDLVVTLDRIGGTRDFADRQREIVRASVVHLQWFFRRLAWHEGQVGEAIPGLSPREAETLAHLLTGRTEKGIARAMDIGQATLHQYVKSVYRKLRTGSRPELMARFVGVPAPVTARCRPALARYTAPESVELTVVDSALD